MLGRCNGAKSPRPLLARTIHQSCLSPSKPVNFSLTETRKDKNCFNVILEDNSTSLLYNICCNEYREDICLRKG